MEKVPKMARQRDSDMEQSRRWVSDLIGHRVKLPPVTVCQYNHPKVE